MKTIYLSEGSVLENYTIIKVLGEGGFGITYLVQNRLGNKYVIKELFVRGKCVRSSEDAVFYQGEAEDYLAYKERFLKEAKTLNKFSHKHIVRAIDYFEANNTAYFLMEYIDGSTLDEIVEKSQGGIASEKVKKYAEQIAHALDYLHTQNFYHRDIKPSNIIIDADDNAKLLDFGLAKEVEAELTKRHTRAFSAGYSPLEQRGERSKIGPYTDLFSLGCTLYYCLEGRQPPDAIDRIEDRDSSLSFTESASPVLRQTISRAMEVKAPDRFQTANDFIKALGQPYVESTATPKSEPIHTEIAAVSDQGSHTQIILDDAVSAQNSEPIQKSKAQFDFAKYKKYLLPALLGLIGLIGISMLVKFFSNSGPDVDYSKYHLSGPNICFEYPIDYFLNPSQMNPNRAEGIAKESGNLALFGFGSRNFSDETIQSLLRLYRSDYPKQGKEIIKEDFDRSSFTLEGIDTNGYLTYEYCLLSESSVLHCMSYHYPEADKSIFEDVFIPYSLKRFPDCD